VNRLAALLEQDDGESPRYRRQQREGFAEMGNRSGQRGYSSSGRDVALNECSGGWGKNRTSKT
jgi:hypothetical protein